MILSIILISVLKLLQLLLKVKSRVLSISVLAGQRNWQIELKDLL